MGCCFLRSCLQSRGGARRGRAEAGFPEPSQEHHEGPSYGLSSSPLLKRGSVCTFPPILHGKTLPSSPALSQGCCSEPTWEDGSRMRLAGTGVVFTRGAGEHVPRGEQALNRIARRWPCSKCARKGDSFAWLGREQRIHPLMPRVKLSLTIPATSDAHQVRLTALP